MPYSKTNWTDEILAGDKVLFDIVKNGQVIEENVEIVLKNVVSQAGTNVTAQRLNNIEQGIENALDKSDKLLSYMAFCTNLNTNSLDAAFGKNNESEVLNIGKQLAMYCWFKGDSKIAYPFTNLITCNSFLECLTNSEALLEILKNENILSLIATSQYANTIYQDFDIVGAICVETGLSNITYPTMISMSANADAMTVLFTNSIAYDLVSKNSKAMTTIANSSTAMNVISGSTTITNATIDRAPAIDKICSITSAITILHNSATSFDLLIASGKSLKAICSHVESAQVFKVSIQAHRATIITVLNNAVVAGIFSVAASITYQTINQGNSLCYGGSGNTIIIPITSPDQFTSASGSANTTRKGYYGADSSYEIFSVDVYGIDNSAPITTGVSMRGIWYKQLTNDGSYDPAVTCNTYTVI